MQVMDKMETLKDFVLERCDKFGPKTAMLEKSKVTNHFEPITFTALKEDILSLGTVMNERLNLKDQKIAVIGENSSKWFITYMATVCGVGVIVPLDKELPSNEILNLLKRAEVKCIVYSDRKIEQIEELRKKLPDDMIYIQMNKDKTDESTHSFEQLVKEGKELLDTGYHDYLNRKINPEAFSILLFTSGTTAKSKGVMLSHQNITSNVYSIDCLYPQIAPLTFLSFLPMHHTYEFTITYLAVLSAGGCVGICEGLKYIIQNLQEIKPDCITCVPLLAENIKKKIEKTIKKEKKEKLVATVAGMTTIFGSAKTSIRRKAFKQIHEVLGGKLKYILIGGAPVDKDTEEAMENFGFVILQGYGLTETSPLVAGTLVENRKPGTVGTAVKDVEIRIDLKEDEIENSGEIMVKGPNVMLGYYKDEVETNKVLKKGWFYTGDIGYFDGKGNLIIAGRTKNVIVTQNGKNIYPEEIENYINKIPLVAESMVYGYQKETNKNKNELTVSVIVTLDEEYIEETYASNRPSDDELYETIWEEIKKINRKLVHYKAVKKLDIKKDIFEKTTTLKIKRSSELEKIK